MKIHYADIVSVKMQDTLLDFSFKMTILTVLFSSSLLKYNMLFLMVGKSPFEI